MLDADKIQAIADSIRAIAGNHKLTGKEWADIDKAVNSKRVQIIDGDGKVYTFEEKSSHGLQAVIGFYNEGVDFRVEHQK